MSNPLILRSAVLAAALSVAGCSELFESGPQCYSPGTAIASSPSERRALTDARARMEARCERREVQCRFGLEAQPAGVTHILVEIANVDAAGKCTYPVSPEVLVYNIAGDYVETIPGY